MFIEISPHEGVWIKIYYNQKKEILLENFRYPKTRKHWESFRLNLNFVKTVYFEKPEDFKQNEERILNGERILDGISFFVANNDLEGELNCIVLFFSKEGEGEFQRIRRIIDENTFR